MAWDLCLPSGMWQRQGDYMTIVGLNWVAVERLLPQGPMRQAVLEACRHIEAGAMMGDGERIKMVANKQASQSRDDTGNA